MYFGTTKALGYSHTYSLRSMASANAILFLMIVLPTVKLATIKFGGFSLTATKLLLFPFIIYAFLLLLIRARQVDRKVMVWLALGTVLCGTSFLLGAILIDSSGGIVSILASFIWYIGYPAMICFIISSQLLASRATLDYCLRFFIIFVLIAYVQLILYFFGINTSYEGLNEPAFENTATIFGLHLLRANSIFGEPRDLATISLTVYFLYLAYTPKYDVRSALSLLAVSFLTVSGTTFLCLFGSAILFFIIRKSSGVLRSLVSLSLALIALSGFFAISTMVGDLGRLDLVFKALSHMNGSTLSSEFNAQAVDLLVMPFIFSGEAFSFHWFMGAGIGNEHNALLNLFGIYSEGGNLNDDILASRLPWFTLYLELGWIGWIFMAIFLINLVRGAARIDPTNLERNRKVALLTCAVWCSLQSTTFIIYFVIAVMYSESRLRRY